ncbi:hypothetical protein BASA50_003309 [Batrachochytrium salamandrivorans]|uniref:Uncharacterized protein n=1 Tax=Batrachochytrium salamandrivorans TaxID=1357716 RepID=A0ABQ8FIU7_9FUNG|nr:hypothetical protein BASA50_003309 [Batrachochytrium salamandrivorans]KAH9251881.1 hypothetical protein BASA81_010201 [Batrachochytrium salamandrivorans]
MKLISFAALLFLVITASAQSPQGSTSKNTQPPQGAAARDSLPSCQNKVQAKLKELMTIYQVKKDAVLAIGDLDKEKQEERDRKSEAKTAKARMKGQGIEESEKLELQKQYHAAFDDWEKLLASLKANRNKLEKALGERDIAEIHLKTLIEHNKQLTEHNAKNKVQIELVPGSFYSKQILDEQSKAICLESEELFNGGESIVYSLNEINRAMYTLRASEREELGEIYNTLRSYYERLLKRITFAKRQCGYTKKLQKDLSSQLSSQKTESTC